MKKIAVIMLSILLLFSVVSCSKSSKEATSSTNEKNVTLTFQIWDINQKAGMEIGRASCREKV